jgi:hypothetical protein
MRGSEGDGTQVKRLLALACLLASCLAGAQIPDIQLHLDVTGSFRVENYKPSLFQFYDVMGRPSIVAISFYTQQGFRAYAAEKLQPLPGDFVSDPFDEYYFEDEGIWRVGKQYLPFGSGRILHESALAARGDTNLIVENVPISFALCDGGGGFDSGVIGRVGSMIGASFAVGRHFGVAATSLDDIRRPEDAPGEGRGWRQAFGLDAARRVSHWTFRAEAVSFQRGETALDETTNVMELSATLDPKRGESTTFAWTREMPNRQDFYRIGGAFAVIKRVTFEPMIRFRDGSLYDLVAQIRVRF